jgi:hypothetical protein
MTGCESERVVVLEKIGKKLFFNNLLLLAFYYGGWLVIWF